MAKVYPVLLSGKQGSGKSTTCDLLQEMLFNCSIKVVRYKFAQPLYEIHDHALNVLRKYGITPGKPKDGRLLQLIGTEWGRETIDQDIWVKCALGAYETETTSTPAGIRGRTVFLIDDLRFKNELEAFRKIGFTIRLEADRDVRKARTPSWRETENHISETDLDEELSKFNHVERTDNPFSRPELTARNLFEKIVNWMADQPEAPVE